MYTIIRKYHIVPGSVEEFIQQVQKGLVPIINQVPGFREYSLMEVGENAVAAISTFESFDAAKASAQQTAAWVAEHTELFIQSFTKLSAGNVRVYSGPICLPEPKSIHEELLQGVFRLKNALILQSLLNQATFNYGENLGTLLFP